jgi:hypothetical protein
MAALRIPITANLDQFKKAMQETSSLTRQATQQIAKEFASLNKDAFQGLALGATRFAAQAALVVGTVKLISAAISGAREQMAQMVEVADKARNLGVSPQFLQGFQSEAKKLKVEVNDLDAALSHAFDATKDKSPVDINEWTVGEEKITAVEKALRVYNETLAKSAGQRLEGLVLFRDAKTQEEKVMAVLKAMQQLDQIGQHAASLDLGERMFGSQFVNNIRQGKTSVESMLASIRAGSETAFSNVMVERAEEVDDQLKLAHQRLTTALKPSWDDLASALMAIKSTWADTVNLIAKAVELSNKVKIPGFTSDTDIEAKRAALATVNRRLNGASGWTDTYGILASRETLEGHRDRLQKEIAALAQGEQYGPPAPGTSRGTGPAPTRKPTETGVDRLDSAIGGIEKHAAALQAEAAAIDDTAAARERSKAAAQLETVAMQANEAAGKGAGVVTEEQRRQIDEVADAYSKATEAIEKATVASSIKRGRQTALLDPQDVQIAEQLRGLYPNVAEALNSVEAQAMRANEGLRQIGNTISSSLTTGLADILDGTKSVADGFRDMSKIIIRQIEEMIIKMLIVRPLMQALSGGTSGGGGFADGGIIPQFATGGIVTGPGGPRDDRVLARVSPGEFVVNADATAKHRALLEVINRAPRFADGGAIGGGDGLPTIGERQSAQQVNHIQVSINGSAGTPNQNQDLAKQVYQQVTEAAQRMVARELRTATRPGGLLWRR